MIKLNRYYTPLGIIGKLSVENTLFWTLEPIDCIVEDEYYLYRDYNEKVAQLTNDKYDEAWKAGGATFLCGREDAILIINPDNAFNFYRPTKEFERFMDVLDTRNEWFLEVKNATVFPTVTS